jgi:hypothetical protein
MTLSIDGEKFAYLQNGKFLFARLVPGPRRSEKTLGMCVHGVTPKPADTRVDPAAVARDRSTVAGLCSLLSAGTGWRSTLAVYRRLKAIAEVVVEDDWPTINLLAHELVRKGRMDHADIEKFLSRGRTENGTLPATSEYSLEVQNERSRRAAQF